MEEIKVVSEIGEQWSPKTPPPSTAAIIRYILASMLKPSGMAIDIMIAKVPQEVPVEKAMKQLVMNHLLY